MENDMRQKNPNRSSLSGCVSAAALAACLFATDAVAGKDDDTLRIGWGSTGPIDNLDAYFNTNRTGIWFARSVWDTLVYLDIDEGIYEPLLATSWSFPDETTLDLTLREGVVFHNGEPFDADDVVYTLNFVADPANGVVTQGNVDWIESAEKTGPYSVRVHMTRPMPQLLELLAGPIFIYPNEYYAEVGPEGMNRMPVGTGPYRVTNVRQAESYTLEKNPDYTWESPKGEPSIGTLVIREIADVQTQVAELLGGGIDFTADISADQLAQIINLPDFSGTQAETMRISYLGFDVAGRSGTTPLQDVRVREAIARAVDREAIVDNLIRGDSRVIHTPCFPTQFGCDESHATIWEHDPAAARALLAEAGYPDGFTVDLYNYRSSTWGEAIIADLANIGVVANLNQMGFFALRDLQHQGQTALYLMDWGSFSINDMSAITSRFFNLGPDDFARDEELAAWLEEGDNSSDPDARREAYAKSIARITGELYWLPMFSHTRNYAFVEDLEFRGFVDEIPRFYAYSWK